MKRNRKKVVAAVLSAVMLCSMAACGSQSEEASGSGSSAPEAVQESSAEETQGGQESGSAGETQSGQESASIPEWLDTSGNLPIVKEGEEKTLSVAIQMSVDSGNPEDMWFYQFIEDQMNINLEVTKFTSENQNEFLSLTFADADLPDIIIAGYLNTSDLVTYGAEEGQLLDLAPYINETNMPNLTQIYETNPEYKNAVMDTEGHVWSLGYINNPKDRGQIPRAFINYDWLEEAGLEVPTTLDEFVDALRAFKERGDDIIPMAGGYNAANPCLILLNAYGYNTTDSKGLSIALRDGKVVLPVADREAYGAYLTTMNTLYSEELIDPDFYTTDGSTVSAIYSSGKSGFIPEAPFVYLSDYSSFWGASPLTSEYNDTQMWPASTSAISAGQFVVSASCEEPELAMAFADWFFKAPGTNYEMSVSGPGAQDTDILYGVKGMKIDPETKAVIYDDVEENPNLYSSTNDYLSKRVQLWAARIVGIGTPQNILAKERVCGWSEDELDDGYPDLSTIDNPSELRKTMNDGEMHFRVALEDTLVPYVEEGYPSSVYLDQETALRAANLLTVITEYAEQESAKFVTGTRSLDELDNYFDEIERLGATEYVEIYQNYYDSING